MSKINLVFVLLIVFVCLLSIATANVLVNNLTSSGGGSGSQVTIGYNLNENATSVVIDILSGSSVVRSINTGDENPPTAAGANTVMWDLKDNSGTNVAYGSYTFQVTASDSIGHSQWERISALTTLNNTWRDPWGIAVNNNTTSSYFGYVYLAVGGINSTFGFYSTGVTTPSVDTVGYEFPMVDTRDDGIWYYSDPGLRVAPIKGAYDMDTGRNNRNDPVTVRVGSDDRVYAANFANSNSYDFIVVGDPTFNSAIKLFDYTSPSWSTDPFEQSGGAFYHFDVLETSSTNYLIYADRNRSTNTFGFPIRVYDIGSGNSLVTTQYVYQIIYNTGSLSMFTSNPDDSVGLSYSQTGFSHDNNGNLYWANRRYTVTTTTNQLLIASAQFGDGTAGRWFISSRRGVNEYDLGNTDLFNQSVDTADGDIDGWMGVQTLVDKRVGKEKLLVCVQAQRGRVYIIGLDGSKIDTSPADGKNDYFDTSLSTYNDGNMNSGNNIDIVGNVYYSDRYSMHIGVFSPPDGPNSFTINSPPGALINVIATSVEKGWDIFE